MLALVRPLAALLAASVTVTVVAAQTLVHDLPGTSSGDAYGYRVASVGDVDLDGADDFVITAPGQNGNAGRVELRSGASSALLASIQGSAGDLLGMSLAVLGDVDGDPFSDIAVGAPQRGVRGSGFSDAPVGPGYVLILSGANLSVIRTHLSVFAGGAFGHSVGGGPDVNGDGVGDFIVGAPVAGSAAIFSGANGLPIVSIPSFGPETGYTVELSPDLDGDGLADALVAMTQDFTGFQSEVRAFSGVNGAQLWLASSQIGGELGWVILPTDDVTGDGIGEVILADREWGNSLGALGQGRLRWVNGSTGSVVFTLPGPAPALAAGFGLGLTHLGDLDGDGLLDLAVASPGLYESNNFAYPGQPLRFTHGWTPVVVNQLAAPDLSETFGQALAAGDFNDDGITDLVVGAPRDNGAQAFAGHVRVYTLLTDPQVYCVSQSNSQGCLPRAFWTGIASAAVCTLRIHAADVLNQKTGLLFWATSPNQAPFGGGTLCLGSPVTRTAGQVSGGNPPPDDCSGTFAYQFTSSYLATNNLLPGVSVHAQYWSRDPATPSASNLSDAVRFNVLP